jgi:hypothetical protein
LLDDIPIRHRGANNFIIFSVKTKRQVVENSNKSNNSLLIKYMQFNSKCAAQLVLSVVGICSLSLPFTQTAQAKEVQSLCKSNESTFVGAETQNFFVSICGSETPLTYVGLDKKTGKTIRLPLSVDGGQNRGTYYEAVNGEYKYSVTVVSKRNKNLTVRKNNRVILREAIIRNIYTGTY